MATRAQSNLKAFLEVSLFACTIMVTIAYTGPWLAAYISWTWAAYLLAFFATAFIVDLAWTTTVTALSIIYALIIVLPAKDPNVIETRFDRREQRYIPAPS